MSDRNANDERERIRAFRFTSPQDGKRVLMEFAEVGDKTKGEETPAGKLPAGLSSSERCG